MPEHDAFVGEETAPHPPPTFDAGPQPVAIPDTTVYLKRWTLVLVLVGTWLVADAVGLGLFYWWFHSLDKTPAVFVVLLYVVACSVAGLLTAMTAHKPLVSAAAVAVMSAPFASAAAASALYGAYFCERASRCLVGVIPY